MNGLGHLEGLVPPIVTWCSCMTSSSADWTLAGARLISSASRKLAKTGPELDLEVGLAGPVDARPDEVGGHQVGRELDALEGAAEDVGEGLDGQRLGQAGDALEEDVAAGQEADEDPLEHPILADDDPSDLEQDGLGGGSRVVGVGQGAQVAPWLGRGFGHAVVSGAVGSSSATWSRPRAVGARLRGLSRPEPEGTVRVSVQNPEPGPLR